MVFCTLPQVCLATLKLFDTLLQKEDEHIFHSLLIRNLLGRNYLLKSGNQKCNSHREKKSSPEDATAPVTDLEMCKTGSVDTSTELAQHETSSSLESPLAAQVDASISSDVQETNTADQEGSCLDQPHTACTTVPHSSTLSSGSLHLFCKQLQVYY